jgi:hypothetical protein
VEEQDSPASQKPSEALHLLAVDDIHPQRLVRGILSRARVLRLLVLLERNSGRRVESFNRRIGVGEILAEPGNHHLGAPVDVAHHQDLGLLLLQVRLIDTDGVCPQVFMPFHGLIGVPEVLEYISQISARPDDDLLAIALEAHLLGLLHWCGVPHVYDKGGD